MFAGVGAVGGIITFIWDANDKHAYWIIWLSILALGVAFLLALPSMIQGIRRCVCAIRRAAQHVRDYDILIRARDDAVTRVTNIESERDTARTRVSELESEYDTAVTRISELEAMVDVTADWQTRAATAEERLKDWDTASLKEGRRRVLGELLATQEPATFGTPSVFASASGILVGVDLLDGQLPAKDSLFAVVHTPTGGRAMWLKCLGTNESGTGSIFAPERYEQQGPFTEGHLRDLAEPGAAWPAGYAILAPTSEYIFEKEQ